MTMNSNKEKSRTEVLFSDVPHHIIFLFGGNLRLVVGESIKNKSFLFHSAIEVDRALVGVVVKVKVKTIIIQRLLKRNRSLHLLQVKLLEIHIRKEWMVFYLLSTLRETQPLLCLYLE